MTNAKIKTTQIEINEFLEKEAVVQVFREQMKPKLFSSIIADKIKDEYQMDIKFMTDTNFVNINKYWLSLIFILNIFIFIYSFI